MYIKEPPYSLKHNLLSAKGLVVIIFNLVTGEQQRAQTKQTRSVEIVLYIKAVTCFFFKFKLPFEQWGN